MVTVCCCIRYLFFVQIVLHLSFKLLISITFGLLRDFVLFAIILHFLIFIIYVHVSSACMNMLYNPYTYVGLYYDWTDNAASLNWCNMVPFKWLRLIMESSRPWCSSRYHIRHLGGLSSNGNVLTLSARDRCPSRSKYLKTGICYFRSPRTS